MLNVNDFVFREDSGLMGRVYGISDNPEGYGGSYRMFGVLWANGLRTAVHEENLVETDFGWIVKAPR
ncbi:MAG: hypothetical protein EOM21_20275 [Gammaproteobacteria bacterium]|nr:hypothetical protein [Gammaproteobacteria bacterium]